MICWMRLQQTHPQNLHDSKIAEAKHLFIKHGLEHKYRNFWWFSKLWLKAE